MVNRLVVDESDSHRRQNSSRGNRLPALSYVATSEPVYVWLRLEPGTDPIQGIAGLVEQLGADSGSIVQCMGSLSRATFVIAIPDESGGWRFSEPIVKLGPMEFLSAQGTWGREAETGRLIVHLHGFVVDSEGKAHGGHFIPGGSRIMATCEVGLLTGDGLTI
ncbi:MAG: hypothetical protein C3F14_03240, partial [Deltaproteobacteria bacterium]